MSVASLRNTQSHRLVVLHTSYITADNREQVIHNYSFCMFYYRRRIPHSVMCQGLILSKPDSKGAMIDIRQKLGFLLTVHTKKKEKIAQDFVLSILSFLFKKLFLYIGHLCKSSRECTIVRRTSLFSRCCIPEIRTVNLPWCQPGALTTYSTYATT